MHDCRCTLVYVCETVVMAEPELVGYKPGSSNGNNSGKLDSVFMEK